MTQLGTGFIRFASCVLALGFASHAGAATLVVNGTATTDDASAGDGTCADAAGTCTLSAAIEEANALSGASTITFAPAITAITLTASLPTIDAKVTIDGANAAATGGRVDIDGNDANSGFAFSDSTTATQPTGANGSTIKNLVVRRMATDGIAVSGHGYTIDNCFVGTTADGLMAASNHAAGIRSQGTIAPPTTIPNLPAGFDFTPAQVAAQVTALFPTLAPTTISNNVVSGNLADGIVISGANTAINVVHDNKVGVDATGLQSVPNGLDAGGAHAGVLLTANAYANVIGPGNILSGNNAVDTDNGVNAVSGAVEFPNFIVGNQIGLGPSASHVGNGGSGVSTDTRPEVDGTQPDNPTNYSLFILANNIADNLGANPGGPESPNGPNAGVVITQNSARVKVAGNYIGLAHYPAGSVPPASRAWGNAGDGVYVTTSDNEIGGTASGEANIISANGRHGIMVKGSSTVGVSIRNNLIGALSPSFQADTGVGNLVDGIHIDSASATTIGGAGATDGNTILGNQRHGIAMRGGATTNGWANLLQRNHIYANVGLGIDLERNLNAPDPIPDPLDPDPNTSYANFGQNQPTICSNQPATDPAVCAGAAVPTYDTSTGAVTIAWTLATSPNATIRIEFFARNAQSQTFLGETTVTTDATGAVTGATCAGGRCTSTLAPGFNVGGLLAEATATDVTAGTDVPPTGDGVTGPADNTSEFSNAVTIVPTAPGPIFSIADASVTEGNAGTTALVFTVTRTVTTGTDSVTVTTSDGTATAGSDYTAKTQTLTFAPGAATQAFSVTVAGDTTVEPDETLIATLSAPSAGATIGIATATGTIVNDDAPAGPAVSIADAAVVEGNAGSTVLTFTVTRSDATGLATVQYATSDGSATAGTDYTATSGLLTFADGVATQTISVTVLGDTTVEPNETFSVTLSNPSAGTSIARATAIGTITNDDGGTGPGAPPALPAPAIDVRGIVLLALALLVVATRFTRRRRD